MRRSALFLFVAALVAPIVLAQPAMAAREAQLVRMSRTSTWSPPSTDPTGLTYNPKKRLLMISDSISSLSARTLSFEWLFPDTFKRLSECILFASPEFSSMTSRSSQ